jgi:hypothetical protein
LTTGWRVVYPRNLAGEQPGEEVLAAVDLPLREGPEREVVDPAGQRVRDRRDTA